MEQDERLRISGYCGPYDLSNPSKIDQVLESTAALRGNYKDRHLDCKPLKALFEDSMLRSTIRKCFGMNLLLWRTNFFMKDDAKNSREIRWHHDKHFQSGDEYLDFSEIDTHFSVFIALKDVTATNGALELLSGSHQEIDGFVRDKRPYHQKSIQEHFVSVPQHLLSRVVQIEMKAGQYLLFHSALLHRSLPYRSGPSRVAVIGRLVRAGIGLPAEISKLSTVVSFN